jgi:excisionase family DNA binding protein
MSINDSSGNYLSPEELAERYGVPLQTVYAWNKTGSGPDYIRVGRHVRYRPRDIEKWEQSKAVASGTGRLARAAS